MSLNSKPRKEIAYAALGLPVIWTAESTLGEWPETGVAISFDNPDGDDVVFSPTSFSVDGRVAIWDLTTEQVATLAGITQWRIQINDAWPLIAGFLSWSDGWTGSGEPQVIGSVVVGPPGPTSVSADANNAASLGTDGLLYVSPTAGSAHAIRDEGTGVADRPAIDFRGAGVTVTDDPGSGATRVTIPGGGAVGGGVSTGFPVLQIDTGGVAITSKEVYVAGTYTITDVDQGVVHSGPLQIKGRGNSTWDQVKKPYRLNLGAKTALLGMTANQKNWAILANYFDGSRMANAFAWELGYRMSGLIWTPEYRTVEVVLNREHLGLYQLCDLVRVESDRVPGTAASGDAGLGVTGTWLLEITNKEPGIDPGFRTAIFHDWIIWDTPETPTTAQATWVQASLAALEAAIQAGDWATWTTMADPLSFADWFLINELISNADSYFWSSCKLWRPSDTATVPGRWHLGPLWDHDLSLGIWWSTTDSPPTGWKTKPASWLDRLWSTDMQWRLLLQQRWQVLLAAVADMGGAGWLDTTMARMSRAWEDDRRRWSQDRYQAREIDYRKRWLTTRITWLDAQIMATPEISGPDYDTFLPTFSATF